MPYNVKEYAALVKKHPLTIMKWCRLGKLTAKKDRGGKDWLIYDDPKRFH